MKVLMSAYVCWPDWGSEPSVGWELLRAAAMRHDVVVLTQTRNIPAIQEGLDRESISSVTLVGVQGWPRLDRSEGTLGLGHLDYIVWQVRAWRRVRSLAPKVDVAHHVTYGNDWLPCALHFLRTVPVIWGPVGGFSPVPWRLVRFISWRGACREGVREVASRAVRTITACLVRRQSCTVVAVNNETARRYRPLGVPVVVEPHVAMPPAPPPLPSPTRAGSSHRLIFAARLTSWKGPYLALATLALLPPTWTLDIFGKGADEVRLRRRVVALGLRDRVSFRGTVPLDELRAALSAADALLFPSMHDAAPFTVAEAVRLGCPVICLDVAGPPLLISEAAGSAVRPDRHAARRMALAIEDAHRGTPNDRWSSDRLVDVVDRWYLTATDQAPRAS